MIEKSTAATSIQSALIGAILETTGSGAGLRAAAPLL
jgi:hypothetical protein